MFVYTGRVHVPRRHATAVCGPSRPCTRPVHSPFTAVYTAVYDGRYMAVRHVHASTPQLKRRARAMYTSVYTASTQSCTWQVGLHGRVHGPRRHATAVGRVHAPCTRSCTRPIHSRVHVRLHGPCTRSRTRTVCRNGPHTAVACRLGTCTRPARPTCRIHGPNGSCTRPCNGRVHGPLHGTRYVDGRKRQCTRPVHTAKNGRAHGPYTAVYASRYERYGPYTAVYTTRYTAVHSRVDGPYTAVYTDLVHVDTCTRPYTCRVHAGM